MIIEFGWRYILTAYAHENKEIVSQPSLCDIKENIQMIPLKKIELLETLIKKSLVDNGLSLQNRYGIVPYLHAN